MRSVRSIFSPARSVVAGDRFEQDQLLVFRPGDAITLETAEKGCHLMLFGGAALNSKRYIWWNFVSSSKERIEKAKEEWRTGRFDIVPGDEEEFILLCRKAERVHNNAKCFLFRHSLEFGVFCRNLF